MSAIVGIPIVPRITVGGHLEIRSRSKRKSASSAKRQRSAVSTPRRGSTDTSPTADLLRQLAETATALSRRVEELENTLASASEPTKITRPPRTASAVTTGRALSTV